MCSQLHRSHILVNGNSRGVFIFLFTMCFKNNLPLPIFPYEDNFLSLEKTEFEIAYKDSCEAFKTFFIDGEKIDGNFINKKNDNDDLIFNSKIMSYSAEYKKKQNFGKGYEETNKKITSNLLKEKEEMIL